MSEIDDMRRLLVRAKTRITVLEAQLADVRHELAKAAHPDAALPPTEAWQPAPVIGRTPDEIVAGFDDAASHAIPDGLTVLEWAEERHANSVRLASERTGEDRAGWLDDAAYWSAIVDELREVRRLRAELQAAAETGDAWRQAAHAAQQRQRQQRSIVTPDREGR